MSYSINFGNVQTSLNIFSDKMKQIEKIRETLIKESREINSLCSKAIILLHSSKISEAEALLNKSSLLIKNLKNQSVFDLDRYLWPAEQEYVEGFILKEIIEKKPSLSDHETLNVSLNAYVTGLLDCIGEIKRMIYDYLRKNDFEFSISLFEIMQSIYNLIYPFSFYDNIILGIRKKLDISKRIIDDVRITITEEYRRISFLDEFKNISKSSITTTTTKSTIQ